MTDPELLSDYTRSGSAESLSATIERHSGMVYATCLRLLNDPHGAEDATQATFLIFIRRAKTLPPGTILAGWLYATAQTSARNLLRSAARRNRHERIARTMTQPATTAAAPTPLDRADAEELKSQLDAALQTLPPAQRNAVILRYFYGCETSDAARQLGCSPETLQVQLSRALSRLREYLQRRGVSVSAAVLSGFLLETSAPAPAALVSTLKAACLGKAAASAVALTLANSAGKGTAAWFSAKALALAAVVLVAVAAPLAYSNFKPAAGPSTALPPGSRVLFEQHVFNKVDGWRGDPEVGKSANDDGAAIRSVPLESAATNQAYASEVRSLWGDAGWPVGKRTYLRFRIRPVDFTRDEQLKLMFKRADQMNFSAVLIAPLVNDWQTLTIQLDARVVLDSDHRIKLAAGDALHQLIWQVRSDATPPNSAARFWIDDVVLFESPADVPVQALTEAL